jgi:hypothetical protein
LFFGLVILKYSLFLIQSFIPAQQQHKIWIIQNCCIMTPLISPLKIWIVSYAPLKISQLWKNAGDIEHMAGLASLCVSHNLSQLLGNTTSI